MNIAQTVEEAKDVSQERNFTQAVDLIINVKNVDLNDPQNRFSEDIKLPYRPSDDVKVCVIGETITQNADNADRIIDPDELEDLFDDESEAKAIAERYDFFIAEAPLMPDIGQNLGSVLGPRNKMPEPMPPGSDPSEHIDDLRNTITVQLKESPSIKCKIGEEDMDDEQIIDNADAVVNQVTGLLPQNEHNIKEVIIKLTMGKPVTVQ